MPITRTGSRTRTGSIVSNMTVPLENLYAAYSMRKVNPDYSGYSVEIQRSSDDAIQDFGWVGDVIDYASILTFCGSGDGHVLTWYDSSGNGNDIIDNGDPPHLVSSGSLITKDGVTGISFGINEITSLQLIGGSSSSLVTPLSFSWVAQSNNTTNQSCILDGVQSGHRITINNGGIGINPYVYGDCGEGGQYFSPYLNNEKINTNLTTIENNTSGDSILYRNNIATASGAVVGCSNLTTGFRFGNAFVPVNNLNGLMFEFLIYTAVLTESQRSTIHYSQRAFFHTYR